MSNNYGYRYNSLKIMKTLVVVLVIMAFVITYFDAKTQENELKNKKMLEMADKMQQQLLLKEEKEKNQILTDDTQGLHQQTDENFQYQNQEYLPQEAQTQEQYTQEQYQEQTYKPAESSGDLREDANNKIELGDFKGALYNYIELYKQTGSREDLMSVGELSMVVGTRTPIKELLEQYISSHPSEAKELEKYTNFVNEQY